MSSYLEEIQQLKVENAQLKERCVELTRENLKISEELRNAEINSSLHFNPNRMDSIDSKEVCNENI